MAVSNEAETKSKNKKNYKKAARDAARRMLQELRKRITPIKWWIPMAETVVKSEDIEVLTAFMETADRATEARRRSAACCEYSLKHTPVDARLTRVVFHRQHFRSPSIDDRGGHKHFIGIHAKVLDIEKPRIPPEIATRGAGSITKPFSAAA